MLSTVKKIFNKKPTTTDPSVNHGSEIRNKFTTDPDFPYLISFPRTGSHWLRMLMELYFEKPALSRAFFYTDKLDFTCYHRHDEDLTIERKNVLYLYRDPVHTIYSQLCYYNEKTDDPERIIYWTEKYALHLEKWLIRETFTKKKTILTYEGLKTNLKSEFEKITNHFGTDFNTDKLEKASILASKDNLKKKTQHDGKVVTLSNMYNEKRQAFIHHQKDRIIAVIDKINPEIFQFIAV